MKFGKNRHKVLQLNCRNPMQQRKLVSDWPQNSSLVKELRVNENLKKSHHCVMKAICVLGGHIMCSQHSKGSDSSPSFST